MDDLLATLAPYSLLFFVSGFSGYTCTLVVKALWKLKLRKRPDSTEPELWAISLRLFSTAAGIIAGVTIAAIGGWEIAYGAGLGLIGGAANTFVVYMFKQWMKKRAGVQQQDNEPKDRTVPPHGE